MRIKRILVLVIFAFTLMACSFTVNGPSINTGVTQTLDINEPAPQSGEAAELHIEMGAGSLTISGGATAMVEGTVQYNVTAWKPEVVRENDVVTLRQRTTSNIGIPEGTIRNIWELKLGSTPLNISLSTGAYEGNLSLGGLSITELSISDGASKSKVRFDSPNLVEMSSLSYNTGASEVEIIGLGNANVKQVTFEGGVGSYQLDFSGDLLQDMDVNINAGVSDVKLVFPADAHVRVITTGDLNNIDLSGTWTVDGDIHEFGSSGPLILVKIEMAVGNLQLIQK